MQLGHAGIKRALDSGAWRAFHKEERVYANDLQIGANSIDVTLGDELLFPDSSQKGLIDPYEKESLHWLTRKGDSAILMPQSFCLAHVNERFECALPIIVDTVCQVKTKPLMPPEMFAEMQFSMYFSAMYDGRSTVARMGLLTHLSAGYGDWGWNGYFTLEIYNCNHRPILLRSGMRIGQVYFDSIVMPDFENGYSGAYQNQECAPKSPVLGKERFIVEKNANCKDC